MPAPQCLQFGRDSTNFHGVGFWNPKVSGAAELNDTDNTCDQRFDPTLLLPFIPLVTVSKPPLYGGEQRRAGGIVVAGYPQGTTIAQLVKQNMMLPGVVQADTNANVHYSGDIILDWDSKGQPAHLNDFGICF